MTMKEREGQGFDSSEASRIGGELKALTRAFLEYGFHNQNCALMKPDHVEALKESCDCGFADALKSLRGAGEGPASQRVIGEGKLTCNAWIGGPFKTNQIGELVSADVPVSIALENEKGNDVNLDIADLIGKKVRLIVEEL